MKEIIRIIWTCCSGTFSREFFKNIYIFKNIVTASCNFLILFLQNIFFQIGYNIFVINVAHVLLLFLRGKFFLSAFFFIAFFNHCCCSYSSITRNKHGDLTTLTH